MRQKLKFGKQSAADEPGEDHDKGGIVNGGGAPKPTGISRRITNCSNIIHKFEIVQQPVTFIKYRPWFDFTNRLSHNSTYHIVTSLGEGRNINKYIPGQRVYSLARGDKNPCLMLSAFADPKRALVDEDMISAALAILNDGDDGSE